MSVDKYVTIWCDSTGEEKPDRFPFCRTHYEHNNGSTEDARRCAKQDGWVRQGRRDLCPACCDPRTGK